jgi:glycosyltransferase involved in cell wall biosynthesis
VAAGVLRLAMPPEDSVNLVSILVPAFNAERWIGATIESALRQTWKDTEIVVVDDGSTDGTLDVARSFERPNVRVFAQPNRGAAAARNRALEEARGEVIQYLDADDLLAPDKIARQMPLLADGVLCSGEWGPFFSLPDQARFEPNALCRDLAPVDWLVAAWTGGLMMQPGAWLLHRDLAVAAGPWDERLSLDDDGEYFARVILRSRVVRFCQGARVFYRIGNTKSMSWGRFPKAVQSNYLATALSTEHLLRAEDSPRTRTAVAEKIMFFVYMTYPQARDLTDAAESRIRELGLEPPPPRGGPVFTVASRILGWRTAKALREPYDLAKLLAQRLLEGR